MVDFVINVLGGVKRLFCNKKYLTLLIIVILFTLYSVHKSTTDYKDRIADIKEFQKLEASTFSSIPDYDKYSDIGARVFFSPGASSIFYHTPPAMSELYGKVNSIVAVNINNNAKTPIQLKSDFPVQLSFSFIVFLIGSLFALYLGYGIIHYKEFLKSVSSSCCSARIYFSEVLSRFIFLTLSYLIILSISLCYVMLRNVKLTSTDISSLGRNLSVTLLMLLFFFFLGFIIGVVIRSRWVSRTLILLVWVVFVLFIPMGSYSISDEKSDDIPSPYNLENQKFAILKEFEENAAKKYGKFDINKIEVGRKVIEGYWNNESIRIMKLEQDLRDLFIKLIDRQESLSILTPVTFYLNTCSESSSYGNRSFIVMYDYLIDLQRQFLRFWFDRMYYNDPKVMVNFIKGDENIFRSASRSPGNFKTGILVTLGYLLALGIISYIVFIRSMCLVTPKELKELGKVEIEINTGDLYLWSVKGNHFKYLLLNLFSGNFKKLSQKGFAGKALVNGIDISKGKCKEDFLCISGPDSIPADLRIKDFISLFSRELKISAREKKELLQSPIIKEISRKTFSDLNKEKRFAVMMSILGLAKKQVYLIDNTGFGLPLECCEELLDRMEDLKDQGSLVIYLTRTIRADSKEVNIPGYYDRGIGWEFMVKEFVSNKKK